MYKSLNRLCIICVVLLVNWAGAAISAKASSTTSESASALEDQYSFRADQPLTQFGYTGLMKFVQPPRVIQSDSNTDAMNIQVTLKGEINKPGQYTHTAATRISDALYQAGGVKKSGSLRNIQILRGEERLIFDAYQLITEPLEQQHNILLHDGDQVVVPPLGDTVAIAGGVKNPAIFELKEKSMPQQESDWGKILNLADEETPEQEKLFLKQSVYGIGQEVYTDLETSPPVARNGDLLLIRPFTKKTQEPEFVLDDSLVKISPKESDAEASFTPLETSPRRVLLIGEFHQPGVYTLSPGETLFELILRSGGLKPTAYPYGAVLTRESLRQAALQQRIDLLKNLQTVLSSLQNNRLHNAESKGQPSMHLQFLIQKLRQAPVVGRVIVQADPAILQVRREFDTILQNGDVIYMPQRVNSIRVVGEVLNAGSFPFISGNNADDYIELAGGVTNRADDERIFAVLPNGVTQTLAVSYWNYTPVKLPPGSTLVVSQKHASIDDLIPLYDIQRVQAQLFIASAIN